MVTRTVTILGEEPHIRRKVRIFRRTKLPLWLLALLLFLIAFGVGLAAWMLIDRIIVEVPVREAPVKEVPVGKVPVGKVPVGKVPVGKVPVSVGQSLLIGQPFFSSPLLPDTDMTQWIRTNYTLIHIPGRTLTGAGEDSITFQASAEMAVGDWAELQLPLKNASANDLYAELTLDVPVDINIEVWIQESTANLEDIVRVGVNKWRFKVKAAAHYGTDTLRIIIAVRDAAMPGFYTINGTIKQIEI